MAATPSNSSFLTPDDTDENQLTISKVVDENNVSIINRITYRTSFKASGINAERNSSVWIWSGNTKLGEATSNDVGEWGTELLDAPHFDCYSLFAEGQWADKPVSPTRRFTVATDTPKTLSVHADGKQIEDNEAISATEVAFRVNAIPNQDSKVINDDAFLTTEPTNGCGICAFVLTDLKSGSYSIKIKSSNDKESTPFRFTVVEEGTKPVTLDKVTDSNGTPIADGATTPDNNAIVEGSCEPGQVAEVFINGLPVGKPPVDPVTGLYKLPIGPLDEGDHIITVVGNYLGGGTAGPHTIKVKVHKPVTLDKVTDSSGTPIADGATTPDNNAIVEGSCEPGQVVEVFVNDLPAGKPPVDPVTGLYKLPIGPLDDGDHIITVVGNYLGGGTAGPHTIKVEAATTAPQNVKIHDADGKEIPDKGEIFQPYMIVRGDHEPNSAVIVNITDFPPQTEETDHLGRFAAFQGGLVVGKTYEYFATRVDDEEVESDKRTVTVRAPSGGLAQD